MLELRADRLGDVRTAARSARRRSGGRLDLDGFLQIAKRCGKRRLRVMERHTILRASRACQARLDGPEIEFERVGVRRIGCRIGAEQSLRLRIRLDESDL